MSAKRITLTEDQKTTYTQMRTAQNIVLIPGKFEGEPTSIVAAVFDDAEVEGGQVTLLPLYVEVTDEIMKRLRDCDDIEPTRTTIGDSETEEYLEERFKPMVIGSPEVPKKLDS